MKKATNEKRAILWAYPSAIRNVRPTRSEVKIFTLRFPDGYTFQEGLYGGIDVYAGNQWDARVGASNSEGEE